MDSPNKVATEMLDKGNKVIYDVQQESSTPLRRRTRAGSLAWSGSAASVTREAHAFASCSEAMTLERKACVGAGEI
jgi:hypothetical protein